MTQCAFDMYSNIVTPIFPGPTNHVVLLYHQLEQPEKSIQDSMAINISSGETVGGTLTGGVQDLAALLPLLGTEQNEDHVSSALTHGYLYAAAAPLSIFGSLGVARAGFKALLSAISIPQINFSGAKILADAGFKPQGVNLSLIMLDEDRKSHIAEKRLGSMLKEINIEDSNKISVVSKSWTWNVTMISVTAVSCCVSIAPYIHLNLHDPNTLNHFVRWSFPTIRALGGFLTTTMIQLLVQERLLAIIRKRLILDGLDEGELKDVDIDEEGKDSPWVRYPALDQRIALLKQQVKRRLASTHLARPVDGSSSDLKRFLIKMLHPLGRIRERQIVLSPDAMEKGGGAESEPVTDENTVHAESPAAPHARTATASYSDDPKPATEVKKMTTERLEDLQSRITEANGNWLLRVVFLLLLFLGICSLVAGYVGCFSAVQGSGSTEEAVIWLCLEAGLAVVRIVLWGINPKGDDAPPLEFSLRLEKHPPFPTCARSVEEIEALKVLPLVRATEFLESTTSYAGLLMRFSHPTLTLYYTLARRFGPFSLNSDAKHSLGEKVLYITIFDHTERTTRIYSEGHRVDSSDKKSPTSGLNSTFFYSADAVAVDLEHRLLTTTIGDPIRHEDDPIARNLLLRTSLAEHYHSILDQVNSRAGKDNREMAHDPHDMLENDWTLRLGETKSQLQTRVQDNNAGEPTSVKRDHMYLECGWLGRKVDDLISCRGKYVDTYMDFVHTTIDADLKMAKGVHGIDVESAEQLEIERLLIMEQRQMEMILVDEVYAWEEKLRARFGDFIAELSGAGIGVEMRNKLVQRWVADLWEQLECGRVAMEARLAEAERKLLQRAEDAEKKGVRSWELHRAQHDFIAVVNHSWQNLFDLCSFASTPTTPYPPRPSPHERLEASIREYHWSQLYFLDKQAERWLDKTLANMKRRLRSEVTDLEKRLGRDSALEYCHETLSTTGDWSLPILAHTDSKWPWVGSIRDNAVIRALQRNQHATHLTIFTRGASAEDITWFVESACSCTSLYFDGIGSIPDGTTFPPNILFISGDELTLSNNQKATLKHNQLALDQTRKTTVEAVNMKSELFNHHELTPYRVGYTSNTSHFTLRFFGPPSDTLTVRLVHRATKPAQLIKIKQKEGPVFEHQIPQSDTFILEDITIQNNSTGSTDSRLTFQPGARNTLKFIVPHWDFEDSYRLHDIELLGEDGLPYQPTDDGDGEAELGRSSARIEELDDKENVTTSRE